MAKEVDVVEDRGSGDTTMIDIRTFLEVVLNTSQGSAYFNDESFS